VNTPEGMMKAAFRGLVAIGIALALSTIISAKGETTKITVAGATLSNPIEITDINIVRQFQVWTGPGTTVCVGGRGNCIEGTEGFIVDWSSGAVAQRPSGLQQYEVSFFVTDSRFPGQPEPEHLAYPAKATIGTPSILHLYIAVVRESGSARPEHGRTQWCRSSRTAEQD
jgi:hypothetical protein